MNRTGTEKSRIVVTISKQDREALERAAEKDSRSLSNLCAKILHEYILKSEKRD